jgi:hypothetical protein
MKIIDNVSDLLRPGLQAKRAALASLMSPVPRPASGPRN